MNDTELKRIVDEIPRYHERPYRASRCTGTNHIHRVADVLYVCLRCGNGRIVNTKLHDKWHEDNEKSPLE